ncbi:hypothetical protein [Mesorhizobium sp. J428]|uniref:hypothetical protein n=1 Tax=Mesorhizobium sp. J428 TaxID=2898440 RepID=UPI002151F879|nr:hypothetical protein [Mesorhizobium sp. J428]MCR5857470.1 hypothetical protein [Mesorhizobium sp. J428]
MNDLLESALAAHGGWDRWQQVNKLAAHITVGGAIWSIKGFEGAYADIISSIDTKRPHTEFAPFVKPGQVAVYEPTRTSIQADGKVIEKREDPRAAFSGHTLMTPWDEQNLIYFTGYAMWTYLTAPFTFKRPGFQTEEVDPWDENGETWRRLKVTFPEDTPSHSTVQTFYFDKSGLLRRQDYSVEIMGGTTSANYASDYKEFGGLQFPTKRRVYRAGTDNRPLLDRVSVSIDVLDLKVS